MPTNTIEIETNDNAVFAEFTRVYKMKGSSQVKEQRVTVNLRDISQVRPSNRLGKEHQRSVIELNNGSTIDLANLYTEVVDTLADELMD